MGNSSDIRLSKFLSKHLRHDPAGIGLTLQPGGWIPVDELLAACQAHGQAVDRPLLERIVRENSKQRFAFDEPGMRIRANQGHSVEVDLDLPAVQPPALLFHGTAESALSSILTSGILKMSRQHVHLSPDPSTAVQVGRRHGRPIVLKVDAGRMFEEGIDFFVSANGVWLTDFVDPKYCSVNEG